MFSISDAAQTLHVTPSSSDVAAAGEPGVVVTATVYTAERLPAGKARRGGGERRHGKGLGAGPRHAQQLKGVQRFLIVN